jgi:SAM-dependent methyltransferase
MKSEGNFVKTDFNFGWKKWQGIPLYADLTLQYQKGDILDVGCATCQLYIFLRSKGWKGKYYGIDIQKYDGYEYPRDIELIIGDALKIEFPKVDTVLLYNILEHVDDPITLLRKAIDAARENVLINIPKRNEEMWRYGVVEYHQLDKTHKHCGFSKDEVYKLVNLAGGKITIWKEYDGITIVPITIFGKRLGVMLLNPKIGNVILPRKTFYTEIWCEIKKRNFNKF